jgi:hypothetical protein
MKSPSELTVVEMKKKLKSSGVTGLSTLNRSQVSSKYRYHLMTKKSARKSPTRKSKSPKRKSKSPKRTSKYVSCKKSQVRSSKTHRCRAKKSKSPKKSRSVRRGPRLPCKGSKVRRSKGSRCTEPGSNAYKTVAELKEEAKEMGLKGLSGKTKAQIISAIKRASKCDSPLVWDSQTDKCRERKVRSKKPCVKKVPCKKPCVKRGLMMPRKRTPEDDRKKSSRKDAREKYEQYEPEVGKGLIDLFSSAAFKARYM